MIKVFIVSDIRLFQQGLSLVLGGQERIHVIGTARRVDETISALRELGPDVVLLDMAMADSLTVGMRIRDADPAVKVVALAVAEVEGDVIACAQAGMAGYVPREASAQQLIDTIESAVKGELRCSPRIAGSLLRQVATLASHHNVPADASGLTRREAAVVELIDRGLSNKEIASELGIEVATVKNHVHNVLEKLRVRRRSEAAAVVRRKRRLGGLVAGPSRDHPDLGNV